MVAEWEPHGHIRDVATILAGNLKSQFFDLTLSLGQSLPPRPPSRSGGSGGSKTARLCSLSSYGCACPALYAGKRGPALRAMSIGEPALAKQNCSNLLYEQFWLRLPRALCGEAGASDVKNSRVRVACSRGLGRLLNINNNNFHSPSHFNADSPSGNTRMFIPWL
jgi:hypothetical protein